jgi:hypothetical protein
MLRPALLACSLTLLAPAEGPARSSALAAPHFDCNRNGIEDSIDIALGSSSDADRDGIPDECEDRAPAGDRRTLLPWR